MIIPIGEWLPDIPDFLNPGSTTATNVVPLISSYGQMKGLSTISTALDARCRGAISIRDKDGTGITYAGNATKIYGLVDGTFTDYSIGGGYSTGTDEHWEFVKWGETIIATNFTDVMQVVTAGGTTFANLGGTPPQARHVCVVRDFVVTGNTYDGSDGNVPQRVRWSGINDSASWTVSAATQADLQDLKGNGGWVQKVVGGEYGVVFQERSIWRMTYVGSPVVFQFDEVEPGKGTPASNSVVQYGDTIFYLGIDGFYQMENGIKSVPIGVNKLDDTFFADLDTAYYDRIYGAIDTINTLVFWSYPGAGNTNGMPNKMVVYNWSNGKWSIVEVNTDVLFNYSSQAYTLDTLDNVNSSIDALNQSLDSRVWSGTSTVMGAFNSDNKLCDFSGTALDAVIETGENQLSPGQRSVVTSVRPLCDGTVTVQVGTRDKLSDSPTWGMVIALNSIGEANVRSSARYHRARLNITGGFTHAQGIDPTFVAEGNR